MLFRSGWFATHPDLDRRANDVSALTPALSSADPQPQNIRTKRLKVATCILVSFISGVSALAADRATPQPANDDPAGRPADYQPSGDYYDWRKTRQPERPWFHKYDQSLVMKIFLAERTDGGRGCKVHLTFEQALEVIERLDRITCGAPKIVYLVGWQ